MRWWILKLRVFVNERQGWNNTLWDWSVSAGWFKYILEAGQITPVLLCKKGGKRGLLFCGFLNSPISDQYSMTCRMSLVQMFYSCSLQHWFSLLYFWIQSSFFALLLLCAKHSGDSLLRWYIATVTNAMVNNKTGSSREVMWRTNDAVIDQRCHRAMVLIDRSNPNVCLESDRLTSVAEISQYHWILFLLAYLK